MRAALHKSLMMPWFFQRSIRFKKMEAVIIQDGHSVSVGFTIRHRSDHGWSAEYSVGSTPPPLHLGQAILLFREVETPITITRISSTGLGLSTVVAVLGYGTFEANGKAPQELKREAGPPPK
jgi:hypothetical protein